MDTDIHFGDLEESGPESQMRPDRNKQFAVAAVGTPCDDDLPVFVDLDVMLEMEEHAESDTSVELGGVMLGGQFHDEQGRPFVLVTDCLRAKHFEATKGSFKFTHDTWSEITREREEFPEDLQMAGWYHTHPDWGVFLSGMDMFICDNFFNRPLDVALVIDPCRGDRGMFQWTGNPANRIRRTDGFYLFSSRFREEELFFAADALSGGVTDMALNRMRSPAGGNTVVQVPESNSWLNVAVLGMLTMQFLLVLLVAVKLLFPSMQLGDERVGDLEAQVARLTIAERNQMRMDAQDDVMNAMLKKMGEGPDAFSRIVQDKEEAATWKAAALGQDSRVKQLEGELKLELDAKKKAVKAYDSLLVRNKDLRAQRDKYRTDLKAANKKLGIDTGDEAEGEPQLLWGVAWWWWPIWGAILLALVGGAVLTSIVGPKDEGYGPAARGDDEPPVAFEEVDEDAGNDASPDHNEDSDRADV